MAGTNTIKYFVMLIEELAEYYLDGLGNDDLENIVTNTPNDNEIQAWLDSIEETCDDINWLIEYIVEYAENYLYERRQECIANFRDALDEIVQYSTDGLKDFEIGVILLEYASNYLRLEY
jgi:hypothetical protein